MRFSYRPNNLRSISDCDFVDLKPITLLVGKNSAGKSTFLRSFALLRQSIEMRAGAPVLWYGERVDFGNYRSAASGGDEKSKISFDFKVDDLSYTTIPTDDRTFFSRTFGREVGVSSAAISITLQSADAKTSYKEIALKVEGSDLDLTIDFSAGSPIVMVGGEDISSFCPGMSLLFNQHGIFEEPRFVRYITRDGKRYISNLPYKSYIIGQIVALFARYGRKDLKPETIMTAVRRIVGSPLSRESRISDIYVPREVGHISRMLDKVDADNSEAGRRKFVLLAATYYLFDVFLEISNHARSYFLSIDDIGPARVRSERFYRQQELQVLNISSDGHNLPNFLASLSRTNRDKFSSWVKKELRIWYPRRANGGSYQYYA